MKCTLYYLIIAALLCLNGMTHAQTKNSYYAKTHTPKDTLRVLFLYVGFTYTDSTDNVPGWHHDEIPDWAKGKYNSVLDADLDSLGAHLNLTYYYNSMSQGGFILVGDVFPELIRVPLDTFTSGQNKGKLRHDVITKSAFDTINARIARHEPPYVDWDWGQYDRRKNGSGYMFDNSIHSNTSADPAGPDGVLDHVTMVFRSFKFTPGGQAGLYSSGVITDTNNNTFNSGTSIAHGYAYQEPMQFNTWWHHEFAHNLYEAPHFFNNNNTTGTRWYGRKGWGFMGGTESPFETALAWEAWWMGWIDPLTITADTTITVKDFVTEGEAVRIRVPHTDGKHYLWLENHQRLHEFDRRIYYSENLPENIGIYAYVTARGNDRQVPEEVHVTFGSCPNAGMVNVLNAGGRFDFDWDYESKIYVEATGADRHVIRRHEGNPIAGQHDFQLIRFDVDSNGTITTDFHGNKTFNEHMLFFAEMVNDTPSITYSGMGNASLAFQPGDEIGISGNLPALNVPVYSTSANKLGDYYLNGLSVKVLSYDSVNKSYSLQVKFNDWEVRESKRWCGDIVQPDSTVMVLKAGKEITLDKSGTPNRHIKHAEYGFSNPSTFIISPNATTVLESKACIRVMNHSTLVLEGTLRLSDSALIIVEETGVLDMRQEGLVLDGTGATLVIKSGGTVRTADGVDFTFSGSGYVQVYVGGLFDLGQGSKFHLEGSGKTDLVLRLHPGAQVQLNGHDLELRHGKVVHESSSLGVTNAGLYLLNTAFVSLSEGNGTGITGDSLGYAFIGSSDFTDLSTGIRLAHSDTLPTKVSLITGCTFYNVDFMAIELERMHRHMHITSCTLTGKGLISQYPSYTGIRVAESKLTTITGSRIGGYTQGIEASHVDGLYLNTTVVDSNTTGLYVDSSNVFIRRTSYVRHNETGVDMRGSLADSMYLLVVGDLRCGNIMQNTTSDNRGIGIKGTNMQLHIDAARHAMARGDSLLQDVAPNRFDGNNKMFNICYDAWKVDTVYARYNYWGGAGATNVGMLDNLPASGSCRSSGAIVLNDDHYLTSAPIALHHGRRHAQVRAAGRRAHSGGYALHHQPVGHQQAFGRCIYQRLPGFPGR
jgi:hypothetical protein